MMYSTTVANTAPIPSLNYDRIDVDKYYAVIRSHKVRDHWITDGT